jgi:hypothetical protein
MRIWGHRECHQTHTQVKHNTLRNCVICDSGHNQHTLHTLHGVVWGGPEIAPKGALYCTHVPLIFESVGVPILKGGAKSRRCESTGNRTVNPRRPQYSRILCAVALPDNLRLICTTTVNAVNQHIYLGVRRSTSHFGDGLDGKW